MILRTFEESDYDDLYEYLSQLENDEFEGYPEITYDRKAVNHKERTSLIKLDKNIIKETKGIDSSLRGGYRIAA